MESGYDIDSLDDAIFAQALKAALVARRCPDETCGGEMAWKTSERYMQLGQEVIVTGTCRQCGAQCEVKVRL